MREMYLRFPQGRKKVFTISFDDNITQDERLIEWMKKYGIKGTFNLIPGWFAREDAVFPEGETYINVTEKKALEIYNDEHVEVANHGFTHTKMTSLPPLQMMDEIIKCRQKLEEMYGGIITGFAYPYGWYSEKLMEILKECGITYARTVVNTFELNLPQNWLELNPSCHYADEHLDGLTERFLNETVNENPYMLYVWGHTFEFDQQNNWDVMERLFKKLSGREEIWFATNAEICNYDNAFQSLVFSADGHRISNPTAIDLWAEIDGDVVFLPAGKITAI